MVQYYLLYQSKIINIYVYIIRHIFSAPTVSVHIGSIIVSTPTAVGNYLLSCSVSGAENLYPTITYRWIKNSSTRSLQVGTNSSTLFFTSLRLTDTAGYICEVTISSNYLLGDIIAVNANPHYVRIQGGMLDPVRCLDHIK